MVIEAERSLKAVFLSASVPLQDRDPRYYETADIICIREAIRAVSIVVLQRSFLVFGGHPAISPFVIVIAEKMRRKDNVHIFQSEYFRSVVPPESLAFSRITWIPDVNDDREQSLLRMRQKMLLTYQFSAAVFIGGMDGVEAEYALFKELHPTVPAYPVASTGGAARFLWEKSPETDESVRRNLAEDIVYDALFRSLPGVGK